jgi:hypothetical protein
MTIKMRIFILFVVGFLEQGLYTLYLLTVNKYMIIASSILMFSYMFIYLLIIDKIAKDKKDSIKLIITYSLACCLGNFVAMSLNLVK